MTAPVDPITLARIAIAERVSALNLGVISDGDLHIDDHIDGYHYPPSGVVGMPLAFVLVESSEDMNTDGTVIEVVFSLVVMFQDASSETTHEYFNRLMSSHSLRRELHRDRTLDGNVKDLSVARKVRSLGPVANKSVDGIAYEWQITATIEVP